MRPNISLVISATLIATQEISFSGVAFSCFGSYKNSVSLDCDLKIVYFLGVSEQVSFSFRQDGDVF